MRLCLFLTGLPAFGAALILLAQSPTAPMRPFTAKDAERGLQIANLSMEVRKGIPDVRGAEEPFKIIGNLYFVGVSNGEAYLLTSPQGHILFGTGFADTASLVEKNIETLGFKVTDIKAILLNHNHGDQSGAAAHFKEKSGAQVMAGIAEIPFLEHGGALPPGTAVPNLAPAPPAAPGTAISPFAPYITPQLQGANNYKPVKVDRALSDGDVIKVGPLSVTAYLAPGHSPSSTSWLYTVREGNRDYRVFEWCCWEFPDDYRRSAYISEAAVHHTFETWAKVLPVDIYLETGAYGWSGMLNQPSGSFEERMQKLRTDNKLWINRDIFTGLSAAREVSFEQNMEKLNSK